MDHPHSVQAEFLLVYSPPVKPSPWWTRWLDEDLGHVDVWRPIGAGSYLVMRSNFDVLEVLYADRTDLEQMQDATVQHVTAHYPLLDTAMSPIGFRTCVTVAKAMLGIRRFGIFTPRQLFNYVQAHGGHV